MAETLDWTKLPADLSWLAGPAERYGRLQFDDPIYAFLRQATPEEREQLRDLSRQWETASPAIEAWLDTYPMTKHPESRLVYFTQHLLGTGFDAGLL